MIANASNPRMVKRRNMPYTSHNRVLQRNQYPECRSALIHRSADKKKKVFAGKKLLWLRLLQNRQCTAHDYQRRSSKPALFMKVRRELMQTRSETGTQRREPLRHTRAVCRRAEHGETARHSRISALAAEASEIMRARSLSE